MEPFNLKFVGEVEKHPELYDYTLQAYSSREASTKAWEIIAKEVHLPVNECKEKWRNLRSTFVKNFKAKEKRKKKKPYYLMEAMKFTVPFMQNARKPRISSPQSQIMPSTSSSMEDSGEMPNPEEVHLDIKEEILEDNSSNSPPTRSPSTMSTLSSIQGDRVGTPQPMDDGHDQSEPKRLDGSEVIVAYFTAKLNKLKQKKSEVIIREEGIKNFLMSLVPDLVQLNDFQLRSFKRKALLSIDEVVCSDSPENMIFNNSEVQGTEYLPNNKLNQPSPQ